MNKQTNQYIMYIYIYIYICAHWSAGKPVAPSYKAPLIRSKQRDPNPKRNSLNRT